MQHSQSVSDLLAGEARIAVWHRRKAVALVTTALFLAACDAGRDEMIVIGESGETVFSLPPVLRQARSISTDSLSVQVEVNNVASSILKSGDDPDQWSAIVNVPANRTSIVNVEWSLDYPIRTGTVALTLAQQQQVVTMGTGPAEVFFRTGGYNTRNHDLDDDGFSNLDELVEGRSPVNRVDAYLNATGIYPTGTTLQPSPVCGTQLPIATQVQFETDDQGVAMDANASAWWCARFIAEETDDETGQVLVPEGIEITVNVDDDIAGLTDSAPSRRYDDDSVEIFIDGNNSKGTTYDGWDDYQFIFLANGDNAQPMTKGRRLPPGLTSDVQATSAGYRLTVFMPRGELGIQNGQPFGINVEVNDDDDGGERNTKFSWVGKEGVDQSWVQPRKFGTAQTP
jgi:hypothetical protein